MSVARQATLAEDRAATRQPTAHPTVGQADSLTYSHLLA
jgi:hypothetical protein